MELKHKKTLLNWNTTQIVEQCYVIKKESPSLEECILKWKDNLHWWNPNMKRALLNGLIQIVKECYGIKKGIP